MKLMHDYKDEDIANKVNISLPALKTRIHRARKQLKEEYQKNLLGNEIGFMSDNVHRSTQTACQKLQVVLLRN